MSDRIDVTILTPLHRTGLAKRVTELWGSDQIVTRGVSHRVTEMPGFIAQINGQCVGTVTYRLTDDECELISIDAHERHKGIGSALLSAVDSVAEDRRLWLITTNDNVDAMRFFQRRGYALAAVYPGAIEQSRRLKPQIPRVGNYGIPIRDELEFVRMR